MNSYYFGATGVPIQEEVQTPVIAPIRTKLDEALDLIKTTGGRAGISSATQRPESLRSLEEQVSGKNTAGEQVGTNYSNWRDTVAKGLGQNYDDIDWTKREFDDNGRVKVTKLDILFGRSQPELQLAYEEARRNALITANQDAYETAFPGKSVRDEFGDTKGQDVSPASLEGQIDREDKRLNDIKEPLAALLKLEKSAPVYAELMRQTGGRPTVEQINAAAATLIPEQQGYKITQNQENRNAKTHSETLLNLEAERDRLAAQTVLESNQQSLNEWQVKATDAFNQNQLAAQQYNNSELRRLQELQMQQNQQLAIMNSKNRMEDRRLDREDRKEERALTRQQMRIEMLMRSLSSLGRAFSL